MRNAPPGWAAGNRETQINKMISVKITATKAQIAEFEEIRAALVKGITSLEECQVKLADERALASAAEEKIPALEAAIGKTIGARAALKEAQEELQNALENCEIIEGRWIQEGRELTQFANEAKARFWESFSGKLRESVDGQVRALLKPICRFEQDLYKMFCSAPAREHLLNTLNRPDVPISWANGDTGISAAKAALVPIEKLLNKEPVWEFAGLSASE